MNILSVNLPGPIQARQLLSGLIAIGLIAYWLSSNHAKQLAEPASENSPLNASFDYYIASMNRTTFSQDNVALHHLEAELVEHFPDDDRAELKQPHFSWFEQAGIPWQVRAVTGQLLKVADLLELQDQVTLSKPLPNGEVLTAVTSNLEVDIAMKTFSTAEPVELSSANMQLRSRGMTGQLDANRLELLNEVSGRHE